MVNSARPLHRKIISMAEEYTHRVPLNFSSFPSDWPWSSLVARPKSEILGIMHSVSRILLGSISRWMILKCSCRYNNPSQIPCMMWRREGQSGTALFSSSAAHRRFKVIRSPCVVPNSYNYNHNHLKTVKQSVAIYKKYIPKKTASRLPPGMCS